MNFSLKNISRETLHREIYYYGLALLVMSLPLSLFGISISQFIIAGNWIAEGKLKQKMNILFKNKALLIFLCLFAIHILWLINTCDFLYAIKDLKIKLPLLILPLVIGTSVTLENKRILGIIYFFSAGIVISSLIGLGVWLGLSGKEISDYREISVYISHIRFSLMINTVIFFLYFSLEKHEWVIMKGERAIVVTVIIWLSVFLFILRCQTGLVVFCLLVGFFVIRYLLKSGKLFVKTSIILTIIALLLFFLYTLNKSYCDFTTIKEQYPLEKFTKNGRPYFHNKAQVRFENGYAVWNYYCEEEVSREWNKRSSLDFCGTDKKGNLLSQTLIRYMTSKGLRKDSAGMAMISEADIAAVENGIPNYIYLRKFSLYSFLYKQLWILDSYLKGDNPSGHSVTQRFEYLKAASSIICSNYWFGTGTGDVQASFDEYYARQNTPLEKKWQLRTHNQFVTFFLTFGLIGFVLVLAAIFVPVITEKKYKSFYFLLPFAICIISFLNEDTLETQAGVTFFSFFYTLFLVHGNKKPRNSGA
jgi:hypothetical protein